MKLLDRYEEVVGHQEVQRLRQLAAGLAGKRIVHVNSTRTGRRRGRDPRLDDPDDAGARPRRRAGK